MADITEHADRIVAAIYKQYELRNETDKPRAYLGASVIGKECARSLWYSFRWAAQERFDGRMLRLFSTGHLAESRFVADLRSIGVKVLDIDPVTGKQFTFSDLGGHFRGNMDGCGTDIPGNGNKWAVLEFKTHSSKSFAKLTKDGVRKAKPEHWTQMNTYMGWSGMTRALYLAVNKDTDELYSERLEFNAIEFERTKAKAESIIFGEQPPAKISDDPKFFLCAWCTFNGVCHGHQVPNVSCRTCVHSTPERESDGRWSCVKWKADSIPIEHQRTGCDQHLPLPFLLTYAEAVDAGDGWIGFVRKDNGAEFVVAVPGQSTLHTEHPIYTTQEISAAKNHRMICDQGVEEIRTMFGASITG